MADILQHLIQAIRDAAVHNPDVQVAPCCILWPDHDRQWEAVIPRLQGRTPGDILWVTMMLERRTGPAIWLRCVIAQGPE